MSAFESAIDDSFDPAPQPLEDEDSSDESLFDNAYNGPRDGRWEVSSSVGSFVDDRCPTVYGYRPQARSAGRETRIDDGLVKKLMHATIEHKRAAAVALAQQDVIPDVAPDNDFQISSTPPSVKVSRPFFVPPLRNKPYNPVLPGHKELPPKALSSAHQHPKAISEHRATATRVTTAPKAESANAKSDTPRRIMSDRRAIRILGKNGEEAFVSLPSLPKSVYAASQKTQQRSEVAASISGSRRSAHDSHFGETIATPEAVRNEKQNRKQKQKPEQKQWQTQKEDSVAEFPAVERGGSRRASPAVMSGALPVPSREPSEAPQSATNSCRDSGIVMSGFGAASKSASSRASSGRPGSAISQGVLSIAQQIAKMPSTTSTARNSGPMSTVSNLKAFEEVGLGMTTGFPTQGRTSDRSDRGRVKRPASSHQSSQASVGRDAGSVKQRDDGSKQGTVLPNYKPPTVHSASSSASVVHSFGDTYQEGFVPQAQAALFRREGGQGSRARGSHQSRAVRSERGGSVRSRERPPSEAPSSKQSRSGSCDDRLNLSQSVKSDTGSSVQSGAKYTSNVASSKQSRSGSRATSVTQPRSDGTSQTSGNRCPSHSPVSPLASTPHLFTPGRHFAGDGWISPHPLSVVSIPQPAVHLPANGPGRSGTLTYSEWKAHRDALGSDAGSYAGSHVPSAVGLQAVPPAVYSHPPPADYVGSYNPVTRHDIPQMDGEPAWLNRHGSPLQEFNTMPQSVSVQDRQGSLQSQGSVRSQSGSTRTAYNNSLYDAPVHHTPSVRSHNVGRGFPPQDNGLTSDPTPAYNVGLTPTELASYQSLLGDTISRHSSKLSHVQREQTPPQPDYEVWNSGQSHSSRRSSSQHSVHNFLPKLSYPRIKSQLAMPWDQTASQAGPRSAVSSRQPSSHDGSSWRSRHNASVGGVFDVEPRLHSNASSSQGSVGSHSSFSPADSQVTYGTVEWQNLENAEEGRGGFHSRQSYKMW